MDFIEKIIPGTPQPKKRHRHFFNKERFLATVLKNCYTLNQLTTNLKKCRYSYYVQSYSEVKAQEQKIALIARSKFGKPFTGAVSIECYFFLPIPKSWPKWKKEAALNRHIRPTAKPDSDNLKKMVMDGLKGVAYSDDSQVVDDMNHLYYSDEPHTKIYLKEIYQPSSKAEYQEFLEYEKEVEFGT